MGPIYWGRGGVSQRGGWLGWGRAAACLAPEKPNLSPGPRPLRSQSLPPPLSGGEKLRVSRPGAGEGSWAPTFLHSGATQPPGAPPKVPAFLGPRGLQVLQPPSPPPPSPPTASRSSSFHPSPPTLLHLSPPCGPHPEALALGSGPPTCTGASSGVSGTPARRPSRGARRLFRPLGPSPGAGLLASAGAGVLRGGDSPSFSGGSFSALPGVAASVPWLPSSWRETGSR